MRPIRSRGIRRPRGEALPHVHGHPVVRHAIRSILLLPVQRLSAGRRLHGRQSRHGSSRVLRASRGNGGRSDPRRAVKSEAPSSEESKPEEPQPEHTDVSPERTPQVPPAAVPEPAGAEPTQEPVAEETSSEEGAAEVETPP